MAVCRAGKQAFLEILVSKTEILTHLVTKKALRRGGKQRLDCSQNN